MSKEAAAAEKQPWELAFERDHAEKVTENEPEEKEQVEKIEPEKQPEEKPAEEKPAEQIEEEQPESEEAEPEAEEGKPATEDAKPAEASKGKQKPAVELPLVTDEYISAYALKKNMTTAEAREAIERNRAIISKYGTPEELAEAYRNTQSAYDKIKAEKGVKDTDENNAQAANQAFANPRAYVENVVHSNPDNAAKLIAEHRQLFPNKTQDMSDDAVLEDVIDRAATRIEGQAREFSIKLKQDAGSKRDEYLATISESERHLLPDIKAVLSKLPDHQVVAASFNFKHLIQYARGSDENYNKAIKAAEERGRKSVEKPQIAGEIKRAPAQVKAKSKQGNVESTSGMTAYEKERANLMFANAYATDEERYAAYVEVVKDRNKK